MQKRTDLTAFCVLLLVLAGCSAQHAVKVEDLTRNPQKYNRSIVVVAGCYAKRFEQTVLQPCNGRPSVEAMVWVDPAEYVKAESTVSGKAERATSPRKVTSENEQLYARLLALPTGSVTPVVVEGEFQTSADRGFGGGYPYRLVLDRVLQIGQQ